jgi:rhomboid protease GluP
LALPYRWQCRIDRWKSALRGFFGGGEEQPRPKLCPACGTLVGISATRCHECGTNLRFSLTAMGKGMGGILGGPAPVTMAILILNILMFGVSWVGTVSAGGSGIGLLGGMSGKVLYQLGGSFGPSIFGNGEWYRLVTAIFLHGGLLHIGSNMMVLMDIGPQVEEVYGSPRYVFLYLTTGVAGFLLSALRGHFSVGASGALMGLIGLMLAITTKRGGAHMRELRSRLLGWVGTIFVIGFLVPIVDNWGHFGGLAAGFALGKLFADRQPLNVNEQKRAFALGWLAGLILLGSFVMMILHFKKDA